MDGPGDLRMRQSGMDLEYLKSVPGLLKVAEIVSMYFQLGPSCYQLSVMLSDSNSYLAPTRLIRKIKQNKK